MSNASFVELLNGLIHGYAVVSEIALKYIMRYRSFFKTVPAAGFIASSLIERSLLGIIS